MQRRLLLLTSPLIPALAIAGLAVRSGTVSAHEEPILRVASAATSQPVDGTVPTTLPPLDNYESLCPGLDLDPELIPPSFHTQVDLIPDPEPFEVCMLLQQAAEYRGDSQPWTP